MATVFSQVIHLRIQFVSVPLDKPEISNVLPTCNSVSFSWSQDKQNYIDVISYRLKVIQSANQVEKKFELVPHNTSQATFGDLEENTEYVLVVKQVTEAANIGYETSTKTTTTRCMFIIHQSIYYQ